MLQQIVANSDLRTRAMELEVQKLREINEEQSKQWKFVAQLIQSRSQHGRKLEHNMSYGFASDSGDDKYDEDHHASIIVGSDGEIQLDQEALEHDLRFNKLSPEEQKVEITKQWNNIGKTVERNKK